MREVLLKTRVAQAAWQGVLWQKSLEEVFMKFCQGAWRLDVYQCEHNLFEIVRRSFMEVLGIILTFQKRKDRRGQENRVKRIRTRVIKP